MTYFDQIVRYFGYKSYKEYQLSVRNLDFNVIGQWQYDFCELLDFVFNLKNKTVLDIGCACGALLKVLKDKYNCKSYGIEIDKDLVNESKYKNEVVIINDEAYNLDKYFNKKQFDFIFSVQTFEHFKDLEYSEKVIKDCYNILKDKSLIYISSVFGEHLTLEQIKEIHERSPLDIDITHVNIWPYETWKELFERAGFIDVTSIVQPVFDLYYFPQNDWSFYREYKWHQIILYKAKKTSYLKRKMKEKLLYILEKRTPPKNLMIDFINNRLCDPYFKKIIEKYI